MGNVDKFADRVDVDQWVSEKHRGIDRLREATMNLEAAHRELAMSTEEFRSPSATSLHNNRRKSSDEAFPAFRDDQREHFALRPNSCMFQNTYVEEVVDMRSVEIDPQPGANRKLSRLVAPTEPHTILPEAGENVLSGEPETSVSLNHASLTLDIRWRELEV